MNKKIFCCCILLLGLQRAGAQELQAKVTVLSQQIGSTVNKNVFNTLQTQLTNMLNSRKWTKDVFQPSEKISCNFLINLQGVADGNVYKASLTVQAARPVFNSGYQSPLINYQDADFTFKYQEYQPVEFSETRVGGTDALAANLTAVLAFYVYMILGLDYDSYALKGGDEYFKKAQNIVNNAPEDKSITGWKPFDGNRNRFWLSGNAVNPKLNEIHDVFYTYYRSGLDLLYEDEVTAKINILDALSQLQDFNQQNPNTMIMQFFLQNRSEEFLGTFKKADPATKSKAREILSKLDISNSTRYLNELR